MKLRLAFDTKFSYSCCIFSQEASTSGYCSLELKLCNSKVVYTIALKQYFRYLLLVGLIFFQTAVYMYTVTP